MNLFMEFVQITLRLPLSLRVLLRRWFLSSHTYQCNPKDHIHPQAQANLPSHTHRKDPLHPSILSTPPHIRTVLNLLRSHKALSLRRSRTDLKHLKHTMDPQKLLHSHRVLTLPHNRTSLGHPRSTMDPQKLSYSYNVGKLKRINSDLQSLLFRQSKILR